MKTTVDLPEPMFRRLKSTAALRGTSMKALIITALERELSHSPPLPTDEPFPIIRSKEPGRLHLDEEAMAEILEEEDDLGLA